MTKAELETKIELLEAEVTGIERVGHENDRLKKKVASLSYKLKKQRECTHDAQVEVHRLTQVVEQLENRLELVLNQQRTKEGWR